jgi:hypothetical protein
MGLAFVQNMRCHWLGIDINLLAELEPNFPDYQPGIPDV